MSVVLNGTGLPAPVVRDDYNLVAGVAPVRGQPVGVWQVFLRLEKNARGYACTSVRVGNVPCARATGRDLGGTLASYSISTQI